MPLFTDGYALPYATTTLVAGTKAVADTNVTANSIIECGTFTPGGTPGGLFLSAKTAGTGFTITSSSATDTSVVWYRVRAY